MATKTITIDVEAYRRLTAVRHGGESFSQAIKRVVREPLDCSAYRRKLRAHRLSDEAVEAIEAHVRDRHRPSARKR